MKRATIHVRSLRGGSKSHLLLADDGEPYVVKFLQNPQGSQVLFNEWLATRLAQLLGLRVPDCAAIAVDSAFIELYAGALNDNGVLKLRPGLHYGSRFVGGIMPGVTVEYLPESKLLRTSLSEQFIGALVFDKWTCNADSRQAVYLRTAWQTYQAYFIDHGHCFNAGGWPLIDAPLRGIYPKHQVYYSVTGWESFGAWIHNLNRITSVEILSAIDTMPEEWHINFSQELKRLADCLVRRVERIPDLIRDLRTAKPEIFPRWR